MLPRFKTADMLMKTYVEYSDAQASATNNVAIRKRRNKDTALRSITKKLLPVGITNDGGSG